MLRHSPITGLALSLLLQGSVFAQQYSFRHYGAAEGLQNLVILSLAQDGAGYIWAGSESGLYRYDGTRFRLMGAAEGVPCSTEVHALRVAADGAVWANTCSRILRFDGRRFQAISGLNAMLAGAQTLMEGPDGHMVVAAPSGLYEVVADGSGGSYSARPYPLGSGLAGQAMHGILRNGSQMWFGCGQRLCLEDQGQVSVFGPEHGLPEDSWDGIGVTPDGSVWVRSPSRLYRKPPGAARLVQEEPDLASSNSWGALTVTRDGSVLVPTNRGLAIRGAGQWRLIDERRGLRTPLTIAVLEDREGSMWIGLAGGGVARWLGYGEWEAWTKAQGLRSDLIWSIRRDRKGALWVGTSEGLARLDGRTPPRTWGKKEGLGGDNVRWIGETSDGSMWAVTKPGALARIYPTNYPTNYPASGPATGRIRLAGPADGLTCGTLHRGFIDARDRLWLATACGVFRNDQPAAGGRFVLIDQPASLARAAWAVSVDAQGTLWVTNPDGLWRLRDGQWRQYRKAEGLLTDNPYVILIAPDGALLLRHRFDAGIERVEFSGDRIVRSTPIVPADPSSVEVTAFHGFDASGNFWRGSAKGVSVLRAGAWTDMSTEDGLIWDDTDGEAFWADADGSVWIGTSGGLAHYTPPHGGAVRPLAADPVISELEISQRPRLIRASFSSLSYKSEQLVSFAYRVDGGPWTETAERVISIAGLAPGRHRLEVRAQVRKGPVSGKVAAAEFELEPRGWETWWLRGLAVLFGAAAVWGVVLWKHRRLRRRNRELEDAVGERTAELESERSKVWEEKKRADTANEAKSRFLAHMSHEIRTPLNGLIGLSELLEDMPDRVEALETVRLIRSSGQTLLRVINDILDFSKIEAGKLELEVAPFPLRRCLEECLGLFRGLAADKGLRVGCTLAADLPAWAAGDETRLRQVVLNLISNALKFTSSGEVALSGAVERQDEISISIRVEVRDTGIGIAPDQLSRLFSSFTQADASITRRFGGTGLGLVISKHLVELMGGAIDVESQVGKGTRFGFTIPLARANEPKPAAVPAALPPGGYHLRVLVAEDNEVNQKVVLKLLEKLGVKADLAADGSQAVSAVLRNRYDLVLMDVQMPEMDGLAATQEIRKRLPADGQPIIFGLTAHATSEYRDICLGAGMDGYLTKPLEFSKLRELLAQLSAPPPSTSDRFTSLVTRP